MHLFDKNLLRSISRLPRCTYYQIDINEAENGIDFFVNSANTGLNASPWELDPSTQYISCICLSSQPSHIGLKRQQ